MHFVLRENFMSSIRDTLSGNHMSLVFHIASHSQSMLSRCSRPDSVGSSSSSPSFSRIYFLYDGTRISKHSSVAVVRFFLNFFFWFFFFVFLIVICISAFITRYTANVMSCCTNLCSNITEKKERKKKEKHNFNCF